ncbi:Fc.00g064460.m01.CDS01 [Cosmosporella sp. VM-42]
MTSSKSFRASLLPSSLSVLRSNSDPASTASSSSTDSRKKPWHKSNTIDLSHLRDSESPNDSGSSHADDAVRHDNPDTDGSSSHKNGEPVPPRVGARKSRTWGGRLSSLIPSLISSPTESHSTPSVLRKAPGPSVSSKSSTTSTLNDNQSTPSLKIVEPESNFRMAAEVENGLGIVASPIQHTEQGSPRSPTTFSFPDSEIPQISMSVSSPQIMAPIPPSPEIKRATLEEEESATQQDSQPSPPESTSGDSYKNGKLQKANPDKRRRSGSLQQLKNELVQSLKTQTTPQALEARGRRSISAQTPPVARNSGSSTRVASTSHVRPKSSHGDGTQSPSRGRLRRSWMPGGGRSRSNSIDVSNTANVTAWVMSDDTQAEYNASFLKNAEKVPELWNESGNVYVYLYPRASGCGPSFKVQEFTVSSSYIFNELIQSERDSPTGRSRARSFGGRDSLTVDDANRMLSPPSSPPLPDCSDDLRLYLPTAPPSGNGQLAAPGQGAGPGAQQELDRLIGIRNLFAFLTGQPLVATKTRPTNFHAFLQIAGLLEEFGFTSYDGNTYGDAVDLSFGFYMDTLCLADCRHSREKTLEALILGERMRSLDLYNEAFAHAAGKYSAIMDLRLPLFEQVSMHTRQALERSHFDLVNRQHNVNVHLEQFEFPALFAGIANSTSIPELRHVRFKVWRSSFMKMRNFVLNHYKTTFGNWPPKASSKKNPFAESGLNRLVLKVLYSDMCALYDLLVDRNNLTTRVMDEVAAISGDADKMATSALRTILSEFDRSKPPVLPPIPYDCPQLPTPAAVHAPYNVLSSKNQAKFDKGIKEHELILILNKAYNYDTNSIKMPFLDQFKDFELREARGKMSSDMVDQRIGYWLFLYVVIQSLPVLVVDAPGMNFTEGVEYFLCQPPMGNPPWYGDRQVRKMWYEVAGGGGLVQLSQDAVLFSVEATYHRSHCWLAAKQWEGHTGNETLPMPPTEPALSPLQPPRGVFQGGEDFMSSPPPAGGPDTPSPPLGGPQMALRPRTHSPAGTRANQAWRSSIALGLEPVPLEPPNPFGGFPDRRSSLGPRPGSSYLGSRSASVGNLAAMNSNHPGTPPPEAATAGATFDDILAGGDDAAAKKPEAKKLAPKKKNRFF